MLLDVLYFIILFDIHQFLYFIEWITLYHNIWYHSEMML